MEKKESADIPTPIIGHAKILKYLLGARNAGTVSHAYAFVGPESVGKGTVAGWFVKLLQCNSPTLTGACDSCAACLAHESGTHTDTIYVAPEKNEISVESIRQLRTRLSMKPLTGIHSIAVIQDAERLSHSASNALLKTLEEPPPHVVLIVIMSRPDMLMQTLRSRCMHIFFKHVPHDELLEGLLSRGIQADVAKKCSAVSLGAPGIALRCATDSAVFETFDEDFSLLTDFFSLPISSRLLDPRMQIDPNSPHGKERARERLMHWQILLRFALLSGLNSRAVSAHSFHLADRLNRSSPQHLHALLLSCMRGIHLLDANVNPRVVFENFSLSV